MVNDWLETLDNSAWERYTEDPEMTVWRYNAKAHCLEAVRKGRIINNIFLADVTTWEKLKQETAHYADKNWFDWESFELALKESGIKEVVRPSRRKKQPRPSENREAGLEKMLGLSEQ